MNNIEFAHAFFMITMAARATNIAALATGRNHCTLIQFIASV